LIGREGLISCPRQTQSNRTISGSCFLIFATPRYSYPHIRLQVYDRINSFQRLHRINELEIKAADQARQSRPAASNNQTMQPLTSTNTLFNSSNTMFLSQALPLPRREYELINLLHNLKFFWRSFKPSLRSEDICIFAVDFFISGGAPPAYAYFVPPGIKTPAMVSPPGGESLNIAMGTGGHIHNPSLIVACK
jgi:hypothetical protein